MYYSNLSEKLSVHYKQRCYEEKTQNNATIIGY